MADKPEIEKQYWTVIKLMIGFIMIASAATILAKNIVPIVFFDILGPLSFVTFFVAIMWLVLWGMIATLGTFIVWVKMHKLAEWFWKTGN